MPNMDEMWCVSPDTMVYADGICPISDISIGDDLASRDHTNQCLLTHKKKSVDVLRITTTGGYGITAGLRHRLMHAGSWVRVGDLRIGQALDLKMNFAVEKDPITFVEHKHDNCIDIKKVKNSARILVVCECGRTRTLKAITLAKRWRTRIGRYVCDSCTQVNKWGKLPSCLDQELAELIGLSVGDGSVSVDRPKRFKIHLGERGDQDVVARVKTFFRKYGINTHERIYDGRHDIWVDSARFVEFINRNGLLKLKAVDAKVPEPILRSGRSIYQAFLCGLFSADGCITDCDRVYDVRPSLSSASFILIRQVQFMLLSLGIISNIQRRVSINRFSDGPIWTATICDRVSKSRFVRMIGFIQEKKQVIGNRLRLVTDECAETHAVCVKALEADKIDVMDLTVTGDHSYVSNGFISHNSAGAPTLQHAGQCICIGTPNGIGNWYWQTVTDAQEKYNDFHLIKIDWWEMDWRLEYDDPVTGQKTIIAPTENMRETRDDDERKKYGKYWSPWLEGQYRNLTQRGDDRKFKQEVLAHFLGSGNTVVSTETLNDVHIQHSDAFLTVDMIEYVNPSTDERMTLEFNKQLWIWKKPVRGVVKPKAGALRLQHGGRPESSEEESHVYVAGVDTSEGDGTDYCAIEVWDVIEQEQVAEFRGRVTSRILARMADYVGRYYNNALLVVERNGIGRATIQELDDVLLYPNLYRPKKANNKPGPPGFSTNVSTKPLLNKAIIDNVGKDGFRVYSFRLYKELCIYVHLPGGRTGNEPGTNNTDDLVMAGGLGLIGTNEAVSRSALVLPPYRPPDEPLMGAPVNEAEDAKKLSEMVTRGGIHALAPFIPGQEQTKAQSIEDELSLFTRQLGGIPTGVRNVPIVVQRKHIL
jgi:hypothetical protein